MQHIVILGATGRLGRAVTFHLLQERVHVHAVGRTLPPLSALSWPAGSQGVFEAQVLPSQDTTALSALFAKADTVIDCRNQRYDDWSGYPAMISSALEALPPGCRYLYVDNVYLYGRQTGPLQENAARNPNSQKGRIRLEVEQMILRRPRGSAVILRFPDFYGPGVTASVFDRLSKGRLLWFGNPGAAHQFIHSSDAALAIVAMVLDPMWEIPLWHVSGDVPITGFDLQSKARQVMSAPIRLRVLGAKTIWLAGLFNAQIRGFKETRYLWDAPLVLDDSAFRQRYALPVHSHEETLVDMRKAAGA
jgi:nucleoside-diphosphate-sugar epimerase